MEGLDKNLFEILDVISPCNGSPTSEFEMRRGLRQGDPLSPLLFIIAMEGLNIAMKEACDKGIFKGKNSQTMICMSLICFMQMPGRVGCIEKRVLFGFLLNKIDHTSE